MRTAPLPRRLLAELLGSALLAALVIGSGIAAQKLSPGDVGLELFENAAATAAGLYAIILMFGPVSGGHFNPAVSLVDSAFSGQSTSLRLILLRNGLVIDRDYGRVAVLQGEDLVAPETTVVMASSTSRWLYAR